MLGRLLRLLHADPYGDLRRTNTFARLRKLVSPTYLANKVALVAYERAHPDEPWFTARAIRMLEGYLIPRHRAFEFGSGKSTVWLARRVAHLVSVEHDAGWHARVAANLAAAGLRNVDQRLVSQDRYVDQIAEFPDGHFDLVVVDALFRDEALARAMPKVARGGWIVFDNCNWYLRSASRTPHSLPLGAPPASAEFERVERALETWERRWTTNGVNDTLVAVKRP